MARAIDADKLLDDIKAAEEHGGMGAVVAGTLRRYIMRQPTLTPQNEPLTIEQLREMDGEPVWGKPLITGKPGEWFILHIIDMGNGKDWFISCSGASQGFGDRDTYGKTWLAYRRPPERQEDT